MKCPKCTLDTMSVDRVPEDGKINPNEQVIDVYCRNPQCPNFCGKPFNKDKQITTITVKS